MYTRKRLLFALLLLSGANTAAEQDAADTKQVEPEESLEAIYQRVFGKTQAPLPASMEADLRINGRASGQLTVLTDTSHITQLDRHVLLPKLEQYLKSKPYAQLEKLAGNGEWISSKGLEDAGIEVGYNIMELAVDITIRKQDMNRRMRSLNSIGAVRAIPENLLEPAKASAYVNLRSGLSYDHEASKDNARLNVQAESSINIHGIVAESQFTFNSGNGGRTTRDYTRLVIDDAEEEHRYRIGDITSESRNFQGGLQLGGIQVSRDLIWADPQQYMPQGDYAFTLTSDSEVEVFQDGGTSPTRTEQLKAGEHKLSDLQVSAGNQTKLRIRDAFGNVTEQVFTRFSDSRLLNPEFSRYSLSVGVPANRVGDEIRYDTKRRLVSGYYQTGVTETMTVGVDFQTDGKARQLGADAVLATRAANISAGIAQTRNANGLRGQAARLQLSPPQAASAPTQRQRNPIDWNFSAEHYSPGYQNVSSYPSTSNSSGATQSQRTQLNASVGHSFNDRFSANVNASQTDYHDQAGKSRRWGANLSRRLGKNINVSLSATRNQEPQGKTDSSFQLGISVPLDTPEKGRAKSISGSYNSTDGSTQWSYNVGAKGRHGKDSLSGGIQLASRGGKMTVGGDVRYQDSGFDARAAHRQSLGSSGKVRNRTDLNLNTAVVFADGEVGLSRPVSDSFIILKAPQGLEKPMAVSRGRNTFARTSDARDALPDHFDALINPDSKAVLPSLGSYRVQHISADSSALPEGFDFNATEFDVLPDYKSGYVAKVGGERGLALDVLFTDPQGKPVAMQGGQLLVQGKQQMKPITFFTDADGIMRLEYIKAGTYQAEFFSLPNIKKPTLNIAGNPDDGFQPISLNVTLYPE